MRLAMTAALLMALATMGTTQAVADCANPTTQADMNMCAGRSFKAADATLNATYAQIMGRLKKHPSVKQSLVTAQRAWLNFRDAECAFSASATEGGSIHNMVVANCLESLTKDRTRMLQAYLKCQEGDMSCPVPAQ
ncbi:MAG TPA: lysozyme inhibitor LprI family protein [Rhodopila sp.]|nr:lysozyme inhibitor LprI family protein [Rhodopila sp.]